jgi:hypothetical protein
MKQEFFSIYGAFAYFTECNLATLERLHTLARSSKSERQRQQNICDGMVDACRSFNVEPNRVHVRLAKALQDPTSDKP